MRDVNVPLSILAWYFCTVVLVTANKALMSNDGFPLPLFLTFLHAVASYTCSELVITTGWCPRVRVKDLKQASRVFVLSQSHGISILLSVKSLQHIEVSFEQAIAASTPAFTATFGYFILGKVERLFVWFTLVPVVGGALISMHGEPHAAPAGICLVLAANTSRAIKSCLQESLMKDRLVSVKLVAPCYFLFLLSNNFSSFPSQDSVNLLRLMSMMSIPLLFISSLAIETPSVIYTKLSSLHASSEVLAAFSASCLTAFLVNLAQFHVTSHFGALSMQVFGNLKTVFVSVASVALFRNAVTAQGTLGYVMTLLGVALFEYVRRKRISQAETLGSKPELLSSKA